VPKSKKIAVVDIETAPALAYVWGLFKQNIAINQLVAPGRVTMVGIKFVGDKEYHIFDEHMYGPDVMWYHVRKLLTEADAVVTYNGDHFDLPKINGELLRYNMAPLPPMTSIDLIKTVKRMGLQSNKLAFVGDYLKIGSKVATGGFELWKDWNLGKEQAIKKMRVYNKGDLKLTEKLYKKLLPYIKDHPYLGEPVKKGDKYECSNCGTVGRGQHRGHRRTRSYVIERIQCTHCGAWGSGKRTKVG